MTPFLPSSRRTKAQKLLELLADGDWHNTRQLSRRIGHTFAVAKFKLTHLGHPIEVEHHPTKPRQFRYRLRRPRGE